MNINKKLLSLAVITGLTLSMPAYSGQGQGQGQGPGKNANSVSGQSQGPGYHDQTANNCQLDPDAGNEISEQVKSQLQYMGEEEKLARDVYVYLNGIWNHNVFANIAKAEQMHIDSVNKFLDAYNIPDLAPEEYGLFNNPELQKLYDSLVERGEVSLVEALIVGALIEEVDIKDLIDAIEQTNDQAMIQMYTNLLQGSYNHLRAFVNQLASQGVTYSSQGVLSQQQVDDILKGENTQTAVNTAAAIAADGTSASSDSCFINKMSKNSKIVARNAQFNKTDNVQLSTGIKANAQDLGKNAKLVAVAGYTSDTGVSTSFMRDNQSWKVWNGQINSLSYAHQVTLAGEQNLNIFTGQFGKLKGQFAVSTGYILEDGSIVYSAAPIRFSVVE